MNTHIDQIVIEEIAEKILKDCDTYDIYEILEKIGGKLEYNVNFDAMFKKTGDESFTINIESAENKDKYHENMAKFDIAQDIAYAVIGGGYKEYYDDFNKWQYVPENKWLTIFDFDISIDTINRLAAAILMPKEKYMQTIEKYTTKQNTVNLEMVARELDLNINQIHLRGKQIGIFDIL